MSTDIEKIAKTLDEAVTTAKATKQISLRTKLSLADAYAVQSALVNHRFDRGERLIGVKMGLTSKAKALQMGVHDVIWGRLTDKMIVEDGGTLEFKKYVHPRIEPEIAFLLNRSLDWPVTAAQAEAAIEAVAPAMEIIDSRYKNFKFSLTDVVADNASSSGFVLGPWQSVNTDLSNLGMILEINGRPVQIGSSAAILGHPIRSLVSAVRLTSESGLRLEEGWIVMAGAATAAEELKPGMHVRNTVEKIGTVSLTVA